MDETLQLFEKLADDLRGLSVHWKQIPKDYAGKEDYCRGRSDGLLESAIALRQVVTNASGIPTEALTPGSVKALTEAMTAVRTTLLKQADSRYVPTLGDLASMLDKADAALAQFKGAQEVKPNAENPT